MAAGEYWRLFTVTLVHGSPEPGFFAPSLAHLGFNMYALYLVGPIVERWYGGARFLLFYLLCAAGGSIASFVFGGDAPSVGASGAIFGLFGLLLSANWFHHPVDRQSRMLVQQLGFLVLINILFGFAIPNIDNAAHIGGLITGLWIGALWAPNRVEVRSYWQRARDLDAGRRAALALVIDPGDRRGGYRGPRRAADRRTALRVGSRGHTARCSQRCSGHYHGHRRLTTQGARRCWTHAWNSRPSTASSRRPTARWPLEPDDVVGSWRAASERADRLVKAVVVGPISSGRGVASVRREMLDLVDAGCRWIEVHEPAAIEIAAAIPPLVGVRRCARRFGDLGTDVHLTMAISGGSRSLGIDAVLAGAYASLAVDLIDGPDNWRLAVAVPTGVA